MKPVSKPITIRFGDVHEILFRVRKRIWNGTAWIDQGYQDLTGYSVLIQVRKSTESPDVLLTYTVILGDQTDEVNGRGVVYAKVTGEMTGSLVRSLTTGKYDIQMTDPQGNTRTPVEGDVTFEKDVSRP
jgi:hypothetical protein